MAQRTTCQPEEPRVGSARCVGVVLALLLLSWVGDLAAPALADDLTVPISLQVDLLARVAAYEQHYAARAGTEAVVLVAVRPGHAESARAAGQFEAGLRRSATLAGRSVRVLRHPYTSGAALRVAVDENAAAIVYLTPGLGDQITAIARALDGASVLTVSAIGSDAERGAVLAFELVAARPTLVVNLRQARLQGVVFSSQLLRLARVIQ